MLDIRTTAKTPSQKIKPEMLVRHKEDGSIGLVYMVTRKWVHVVWLVNRAPDNNYASNRGSFIGGHHFAQEIARSSIEPCPAGTEVTIKQVNNGQ